MFLYSKVFYIYIKKWSLKEFGDKVYFINEY